MSDIMSREQALAKAGSFEDALAKMQRLTEEAMSDARIPWLSPGERITFATPSVGSRAWQKRRRRRRMTYAKRYVRASRTKH